MEWKKLMTSWNFRQMDGSRNIILHEVTQTQKDKYHMSYKIFELQRNDHFVKGASPSVTMISTVPYLCCWAQKQTCKINLRKGYTQFWYHRCSSNITLGWELGQLPNHKNGEIRISFSVFGKLSTWFYLVSPCAWVWPHFGIKLGKHCSPPLIVLYIIYFRYYDCCRTIITDF